MREYIFVVFSAWLLLASPLMAQKNLQTAPEEDPKKLIRKANEFFRVREYLNAIPYYKQVLVLDSNHLEANYKLALSYLKSLNERQALFHILRIRSIDPKYDPLLDFFTAESYKHDNQMDTAIYFYRKSRSQYVKESGNVRIVNDVIQVRDFIQLIDQRIKEAQFGIKFLTDPTNASVINLGDAINSEYNDYAPVISADESVLIFTSRKENTTGGGRSPEDNQYYEDIYISTHNKKKEWEKNKKIGRVINSKYNEASIALSPDGTKLFIYKDENGGDIYESDRTSKNNWSRPRPVEGGINTKYHEPSMSITDDGNTIYFSSDRPGGKGGLDIYKIEKDENGNWSDPINLGDTINTEYDDDSPFIHFDRRTLYFSSQGHEGIGGHDIFYSEFIDGSWSIPENLGYPINTPQDDLYFVLSADYKTGYYASAQDDGLGGKDVYQVKMPDYKDVELIDFQLSIKTVSVDLYPLATEKTTRAVVILRGVVKDELTDELISAKMSLVDPDLNQVVSDIDQKPPNGAYVTTMQTGRRYILFVQKEGYLYHTEHFEIPDGVVNQEKVLNIYLRRIKQDATIDFKALFDYNSARLKKESLPSLENLSTFLESNSSIQVELQGHTDSIGTDERNQILSENRAKAVYDYLIEDGIDEDRLSYKGFGESEPVADNGTAYGRSLNRRTVLKIIKESI